MVRTWREAKSEFDLIYFITKSMIELGRPQKEINEKLADHKRELRSFLNEESDRKFIKGDYDGWIELITLPDGLEDPDEYFHEYEYRVYIPSQYDCTGQTFTQWYKIFERNGKTMAYHSIGVDI